MKKSFFGGKKITPVLICFILGIILLFLSEYSDIRKTENETDRFEQEYTLHLESRLADMIGRLEGVSDVSVMITLEGGVLYQKEMQNDESSVSVFFSGNTETERSRDLSFPSVKGVSVVCKGASNPKICHRILSLVASTLNLNENQIFVCE